MADPTYKKISELNELAEKPAVGDMIPLVDVSGTETKRVSFQNLAYAIAAAQIATGAVTAEKISHLGLEALVDPDADRIMFWDDSAGMLKWLSLGGGLGITGTEMETGISEANLIDGSVTDPKWGGSYLYGFIVVPDTQYLVIKNSLLTFPVADIHDGKNVLRITARIATTSSSGSVAVRVYNATQAALIGTALITATNTIAYTESFTTPLLAANDIFRIDITANGTGAKGLNVLIRIGT